MAKGATLTALSLKGYTLAPAQMWGAIRLVPLLRPDTKGDLRLGLTRYGDELAQVALARRDSILPRLAYYAYVPHGLIMSWSDDGAPAAIAGGQLQDGERVRTCWSTMRLLHRMVKRKAPNRLRFLPLHLAMESYLSIHFGGPDVAWKDYSRRAISQGLSSRSERMAHGRTLPELDDALRVFEIHEHQVGVLLFVADALASAFIVPTPRDYQQLHASLIEDFYAEILLQYAAFGAAADFKFSVDPQRVTSLSDIAVALDAIRADWADFQGLMADNLLNRPLESKKIYAAGPFILQQFITDLALGQENHMGEAIVRKDGQLEYLKTFRLSETQARRAYLLKQLAAHDWNLQNAAQSLGNSVDELILRLDKIGFGELINRNLREQVHKRERDKLKKK